jgi:aspartate racemase
VTSLCDAGAEGIILGCTEIGLLLEQKDTSVPLFDTTFLHAQAAVRLAIDNAH